MLLSVAMHLSAESVDWPCSCSLQGPFKSEAPVLVEIFMHLFAGVEPQQLLDAPQLLAQQQVGTARFFICVQEARGSRRSSSSSWCSCRCNTLLRAAASGQAATHITLNPSTCPCLDFPRRHSGGRKRSERPLLPPRRQLRPRRQLQPTLCGRGSSSSRGRVALLGAA